MCDGVMEARVYQEQDLVVASNLGSDHTHTRGVKDNRAWDIATCIDTLGSTGDRRGLASLLWLIVWSESDQVS